jgi:hypothetical protein
MPAWIAGFFVQKNSDRVITLSLFEIIEAWGRTLRFQRLILQSELRQKDIQKLEGEIRQLRMDLSDYNKKKNCGVKIGNKLILKNKRTSGRDIKVLSINLVFKEEKCCT